MRLSDDWGFYRCELGEGLPGMILVDLGAEPQPDKPLCLKLSIRFVSPAESGFPTQEESEALFAFEDRAEDLLEQVGAAYVGRVTGDGGRELVFYVPGGEGVELRLRELQEAFPEYALEASTLEDPDWEHHREAMLPDALGRCYIENTRAVRLLDLQGDPLVIERPVRHTAWLPDEEAARQFAASFGAEDWIEVEAIEAVDDGWRTVLRAHHHVELDLTHEITHPMVAMCDELGGRYRGWTCEIPPVVPAERTSRFWDWFTAELPRLTAAVEQDVAAVVNEVGGQLDAVAEGLGAVIGQRGDEPWELVVTAHGNPGLARAVEDVVATAPALEGWFATAFRPPEPKAHDALAIDLEGETLSVGEVRAQVFRGPAGELGITLHVPELTEERRDKRSTAAVILMDHVVGERDALLIDSLEVEPLEELGEAPSCGLLDLREVLGRVRAERTSVWASS